MNLESREQQELRFLIDKAIIAASDARTCFELMSAGLLLDTMAEPELKHLQSASDHNEAVIMELSDLRNTLDVGEKEIKTTPYAQLAAKCTECDHEFAAEDGLTATFNILDNSPAEFSCFCPKCGGVAVVTEMLIDNTDD